MRKPEGGEAAETSAETAKAAVADQVTTGMAAANETVPAAEAEETADIAQIMMEDIVAANDAPRPKVPETQGSEDALPTFSRGFQKTRYAGKNKQKDPKAAG